jgi:hypothetical protein
MESLHFSTPKLVSFGYYCVKTLLDDNRRIIFETSGLDIADVVMTFNRLLGNPEFGKAGVKPPELSK